MSQVVAGGSQAEGATAQKVPGEAWGRTALRLGEPGVGEGLGLGGFWRDVTR